jgi:hypothetical protein
MAVHPADSVEAVGQLKLRRNRHEAIIPDCGSEGQRLSGGA